MKNQKGFAALAAVLVVFGAVALGVGGYVAMNPEVWDERQSAASEDDMQTESTDTSDTDVTAQAEQKISIDWRFTDAGEVDNIPYTNVTVVINGAAHEVGEFQGSCHEIDGSGGIDGTGLLVGELSGVQCWFAGGGDEIGVFAHEDGGVDIMTGGLSEGVEGGAFFRGDFEVRQSLTF